VFYVYFPLQTSTTLVYLRCYIWKISENFRGSAQIFFAFGSIKIWLGSARLGHFAAELLWL